MQRFHVTTFGCQMNVHDSERIKGMLEAAGMGEAPDSEQANVLVFNTCTIRERADDRLIQALNVARGRKEREPELQIVVAGCWAESVRDDIFRDFPWVDAAVGPGRIGALRDVMNADGTAERGAFGSFDDFAADLPKRRERSHQAWLQLSMGCNSVCSYCIVPSVRGRERSRNVREILAEANQLASEGVTEVVLLGQNVNSYGRDLAPDARCTFAELLRAIDAIDGIDRIRFMSPHPKDMRGDVIAAMAESPSVCNQLHLPLQSGSSRILKRMRRTYDSERYLELVARVREAMPDIALTTDIIVGFPGETEEDFQETLRVYDEAAFDHAYTFIYSARNGTEAAGFDEQLPDDLKHERLGRLVDLVQDHAARRNTALIGSIQEVLCEGPSRKDADICRGKTRGNKTTLFTPAAPVGTVVSVRIEDSTSQTLRGQVVSAVAV
ncbi:MAG: tRNA (N6-isopentenyl adenosine(37)-C2)-methylthiotransferase MiaB [Thermoleophilia bacterium]|jgi:tRNA-2-methylthio-N6-dimethylallyladenosine synthase|nr:tRNA (N6-isopentenyl adenosine(37)-C2)-methylthiotransferase MiaB [Thermoleophilia bacterium]